jgi:fatty-acyl-CoA synthase
VTDPVVSRPRQPGPERVSGSVYIERVVGRLRERADTEVLVYRDRRLSGLELASEVFRYARALRRLGIGPGKLVALFAPNHPEAIAIRYAASLLGAPSAFLARPSESARREALLTQTDPALLVVFPGTAVPGGDHPPQGRVASVGVVPGVDERIDQLAHAESSEPLACTADPADLGIITSSGGTTGVPKGSYRSFAAYTAMVDVPSERGRRQLIVTPLAYLAQILIDMTLLAGGTVVLRDDSAPSTVLAAIASERITDMFLVEPALFELMDQPRLGQWDLSSLRNILHIGSSAPEILRSRATQRFGAIIQHTYGSSEMGVVSTLRSGEAARSPGRAGTAGRILPGVEVVYRRLDGSLAPPHEGGVVEVRSAALAGGYWHQPEETAAAFSGGWYRSGDIAFTDDDGYLHYVGRAADLEVTNGISLTKVEDMACRQPDVRYAVALPGESPGEIVVAVVPWPGQDVHVEGCRQAIDVQVSSNRTGPIKVVVVDRIPVTEQGKPDRHALRLLTGSLAQSVDLDSRVHGCP